MDPRLLTAALLFVCLSTVLGDGCHTPVQDIGDEAGLAADVCSINTAIRRSPPDYITAGAFYRRGFKSRNITLEDIATGEATQGEVAELFAELFGEDAWLALLIDAALEGEGAFTDASKRGQFVRKGLQAGALGQRMFSNLNASQTAAADGDGDGALTYLERAMANFFGSNSDCAIYSNGLSRAIDFGTLDGGIPRTNYAIVKAFGTGAEIIKDDPIDVDALSDVITEIKKNFITIYLQAVTRYSTLIIAGVDPIDSHAEGYAYYHPIAGFIYAENETAHETIINAFNISGEPDEEKAEEVLDLIPVLLEAFNISESSFGEFNATREEHYEAPEIEDCEGVNPFVDSVVIVFDADDDEG